jgi:tetratricopeptide (TPR) repeat protein
MIRRDRPDERWETIWAVFHEAVERTVDQRAAFLDEACGDDPDLRREVEELLAAHEEGLPVLDESLPVDLGPAEPEEETELWTAAPLTPGNVLAERFEVLRRIGVGGMGEVYEAEDRELGRRVALKTLLAGRARSPSSLARFRKEIHLAQQVTHRNVCRVFDLMRDGDLLFLSMELLRGETLAARLERHGRLSLDESRAILDQVVAALEAAHSVGVIHRDLKPSNVVLVEEPSGLRAVVTDFGLATSGEAEAASEAHLTQAGEVIGTPSYMAPEQLERKDVGPTTDVYALGLLLYEMVTGKRPFGGGSAFSMASRRLQGPPPAPREHLSELPESWERVILRCLARHPADRFQHPREVPAALDDPSGTQRVGWGRVGSRRRVLAVLALTALAVALVLLLESRLPWVGSPAPPKVETTGAAHDDGPLPVTTTSERALRFYREAEAAIPAGRNDAAEELVRAAIREDPGFASAHLLLAYTIHNQERPPAEYLPHAERAMELAESVTDHERYFIRASYYDFTGDEAKMLANYEALLRIHPDHFWANNNMAWLAGPRRGAVYRLRLADLRPRDPFIAFGAAHSLAIGLGRPQEVDPYVARMLELAAGTTIEPWQAHQLAWARLWTAHRHWLAGDLDVARAELDRRAAELGALGPDETYWVRQLLARGYRTLGLAERARELTPPHGFYITRHYFAGLDAYFVGDVQGTASHFTAEQWQDEPEADQLREPLRVAALARSGFVEEARAALASFRERPYPDHRQRRPVTLEARMEAELLIAEGRFGEAARLLETRAFGDDVLPYESVIEWYGSSYFLAAQALATAYRELGRDEDAVDVLEQAVAERPRSYPNGAETWLDTQLRLARLHRDLGNIEEATRLENELRELMRLADRDFWLVRELEELEGP